LFDQFRIIKVVWHLHSQSNAINVTGASANQPGFLAYSVDYDDGATPTSLNYMLQYDQCKILLSHESADIQFVPRATFLTIGTTGAPAANSTEGQWMNVGQGTATQYFGFKFYVTAAAGSSQITNWFYWADMYFEFKSTR